MLKQPHYSLSSAREQAKFPKHVSGDMSSWSPRESSVNRFGRVKEFKSPSTTLAYATMERDDATGAVVILTGWNECMLKYVEIAETLYDAGFSVSCVWVGVGDGWAGVGGA